MNWVCRSVSDPAIFWLMLTAVGTCVLAGMTVALFIVAKKQLTNLAETSALEQRTNRANFVYRIRRDFFTPQARQLMFLIEENLLKFHPEDVMHFSVEKSGIPNVEDRLADLDISYSTVSSNLLDDTLLGPLEDVAIFWKSDLLSLDDVYEEFDYYIHKCTENTEIQRYLATAAEEPNDADVYENLLILAGELKIYREKKNAGKSGRN